MLVEIEGVELKVCAACTKYGTIKKREFKKEIKLFSKEKPVMSIPEFKVVDDYATLIRSAREKRGMKQEDFAKLLNERESLVAKWEQGNLKPRLDAAKKVGQVLGINLLEKEEEIASLKEEKRRASHELTLGDFVKIRKRK